MNAREYLIHRLQQGLRGRDPEAIADLILNGHAHELAEEMLVVAKVWSSDDLRCYANIAIQEAKK